MNEIIIGTAQAIRGAGLLTNDSLLVAAMREHGLSYLASNDSDFERVSGITFFKPIDLP